MTAGKNVVSIQIQPLSSFVYDFYINKYGLITVAERKAMQLLVSCFLNRHKSFVIELFTRFVGLTEIKYSADDLDFLFKIVLYFLKGTTSIRRESIVFDLVKKVTIKSAIEIVNEIFQGKECDNAKIAIEKENKNGIDANKLYIILIDNYREAKIDVIKWLNPETDFYTMEEFLDAIKSVE